jgi:intein-encoded DNA endonuclease-like protein
METTPGICYLAGAFRDGCISTQWQIKIKQKSRKYLLNKIIPTLNQEFDLDLTERALYLQADANRRFYVAFKKKKTWEQLRKVFSIPPDSATWGTPPFVKKLEKNLLRFYIQGFFDAEGGVPRNPMNSKLYITFTQRNRESLEFLKEKLHSKWGIVSGKLRISDSKSLCWRFTITGLGSIKRFITEIGTEHPSKGRSFTIISNLLEGW